MFDSNETNFVAPDHLLSDVASNATETSAKLLYTKGNNSEMDAVVCDGLRDNFFTPNIRSLALD